MLRDTGIGLGPWRGRQHTARPVAGDLDQRVIHRFRPTQGDGYAFYTCFTYFT